MQGWIKLYRKLLESWFYKDSEAVHLWVTLLLKASHADHEFMFNMKRHKLKAGQLLTGRKVLNQETGISESKIFRLLKSFESEQLIEQQTNSRYSIITILSWDDYQQSEQPNEQPANSQRTHTRMKELKNNIGEKQTKSFKVPLVEEIKDYCIERKNNINPENFFDYYQSKGWVVGKSKMKDWKACVRTWENNQKPDISTPAPRADREYTEHQKKCLEYGLPFDAIIND